MEEKDGIIMFEDKMYNLDEMSTEELDILIDSIENEQRIIQKNIIDLVG
ncbi:MAG: hypothetical protein RR922_06980 [Clostridia bacterium]